MSEHKFKYGYLAIPDKELTQVLQLGIKPATHGWRVLRLEEAGIDEITNSEPSIWSYKTLNTAGIYELCENEFERRKGLSTNTVITIALAICEWTYWEGTDGHMYRMQPVLPESIIPLQSAIDCEYGDNNDNCIALKKCAIKAMAILKKRNIKRHDIIGTRFSLMKGIW